MKAVIVKNLTAKLADIDLSRKEILRYMRCANTTDKTSELVESCVAECKGIFDAKLCYCEYDIKYVSNGAEYIDLGFCVTESKDLAKALEGCDKVIAFCATVGIELDRRIAKYSVLSPSKAFCVSAIGSERIEALCDLFCAELKDQYKKVKPRYSAGYGDLPLDVQKDIFRHLDCYKKIGVALNDSLLMTPSKSVTAIVGIESED